MDLHVLPLVQKFAILMEYILTPHFLVTPQELQIPIAQRGVEFSHEVMAENHSFHRSDIFTCMCNLVSDCASHMIYCDVELKKKISFFVLIFLSHDLIWIQF